jgi:hypothetical protein
MDGVPTLLATPTFLGLKPGQEAQIQFRLSIGGVPVAGDTVTFTIPDASLKAQGATLTPPSAVTNASGTAVVTVRAGQTARFQVHAISRVEVDVEVAVAPTGQFGEIVAIPLLTETTRSSVRNFEVMLFDGFTCDDVAARLPPALTTNRVQLLPLHNGSAKFETVSTATSSALVGRALSDSTAILATGCVDVPGGALVPGGSVTVRLPLAVTAPDPSGTYTLTSTFFFSPTFPGAAELAAPWRDLSDCPLDPAQMWLDCTIDALSTSAYDALDCVPAPAPGSEGALGDALTALRGVPLGAGTQTGGSCRGGHDANGQVSIDALALDLFGAPLPARIAELPAIADDATHILDQLTLVSALVIQPGSAADNFVATHTLDSAQVGPNKLRVTLAPLGLPILSASAPATAAAGMLTIGAHGFTVRLGTVAEAAFSASLVARGREGDATAFVEALIASASPTGAGCAALDATLCPRVGSPAGCLLAACAGGVAAMAARLAHAFDAANGVGVDFALQGSAPIVASPRATGLGNRVHLGGVVGNDFVSGAWHAVLRTSTGSRIVNDGSFLGQPEN